MKRLRLIAIGFAVWIGLGICHTSEARSLYKSVYEEVFKKEIEDSKDKKLDCTICHEGADKKKRTDYGKELEKELGEKNVKDKEKIKEALKKIGPHPKHKQK